MKKKNFLALIAGIPDDADIVFEKFENEKVIKKISHTNGDMMDYECVRIDVDPNTELMFHGMKISTDSSDEIDTVYIRFTE